VLTSAERSAREELEKITEAKTRATRELESAKREMESARSGVASANLPRGCEQCAEQLSLYERYEHKIEAFEVAKSTFSNLDGKEQQARDKLARIQSEKQVARNVFTQMENRQQQDTAKLRFLYSAWKANPTDENYKSLTGHLTEMSAQFNNKYDVTFITQGMNNQWTEGARINYETVLQRRNNSTPIGATNCTTKMPSVTPACVKEGMPKGWYYIWSVRAGRVTSSKGYYTEIGGTTTVTINEDQP
jgi:hypothetical protein